jgi:hypothetical protein
MTSPTESKLTLHDYGYTIHLAGPFPHVFPELESLVQQGVNFRERIALDICHKADPTRRPA